MIEVDAFNARVSAATLPRTSRVTAPDIPSTNKSQVGTPLAPTVGQSFRQASRSEGAVFALDLTGAGAERANISDALAGTFEELLEIFHGRGKAGEALESALASVSELIDKAAAGADVVGIQIRVASVARSFGEEDGDGASYGSVTGFAIEVGLVRGQRVNAEDVRLVGLAGERVELSVEQRRTGVVDGFYRIQDDAPFGEEVTRLRGENKAQVEALRNALDRLRLVQDALKSYRNGDTRALEDVEKLFRSGTLDSGAVRAISDIRGPSQTVVPGSGVVTFS